MYKPDEGLQRWLDRWDLSHAEAAALFGVNRATITKWVDGRIGMSAASYALYDLLTILGGRGPANLALLAAIIAPYRQRDAARGPRKRELRERELRERKATPAERAEAYKEWQLKNGWMEVR